MIIMNRNPELAEHSPKTNSVLFIPLIFDISANKGHIIMTFLYRIDDLALMHTLLSLSLDSPSRINH